MTNSISIRARSDLEQQLNRIRSAQIPTESGHYQAFFESTAKQSLDSFSILVSQIALTKKTLSILQEGKWVHSGKDDWWVRKDPENPQTNALMHVHVAKKKHIKSQPQYSWDKMNRRHDAHKFGPTVPKVAKQIAAKILKTDPALLETVSINGKAVFLEHDAPGIREIERRKP